MSLELTGELEVKLVRLSELLDLLLLPLSISHLLIPMQLFGSLFFECFA